MQENLFLIYQNKLSSLISKKSGTFFDRINNNLREQKYKNWIFYELIFILYFCTIFQKTELNTKLR